jgi:hypothetical protein
VEKSTARLRSAFQRDILTLPLTSILPQKITDAKILRSAVFKQILASVREVGLIESLVVFPQEDKGFLLLDGHLRLESLRILGVNEASCILSTDDESYTYNQRHEVSNGILMRSDLHRLFDEGYITIDPLDRRIQVSGRIREEFENGKDYYKLHGQSVRDPSKVVYRPLAENLEYHAYSIFR